LPFFLKLYPYSEEQILGYDSVQAVEYWASLNNVEKPWNYLFLLALEKCKLLPGQMLYVGDRIKDVIAANTAGIQSILYLSKQQQVLTESITSIEKPKFTITSLTEVLDILT
jgi:FMN phosphatase YigB (HAD superfamily)